MSFFKNNLYLFAFLEGAVVMAVELLVARMLAPFFGSSLYIWGSVIGVTFLSLAIGYFFGGRMADKYPQKTTLWWMMLLSSLIMMIMPALIEKLTVALDNSGPVFSVVFISVICLLPTLGFLGMVPTMLIRLQSAQIQKSGRMTGNVYTISSLGGIISIFLMGYWLIPVAGLTVPAYVIGIITGIIPFFRLIGQKKYLSLIFVLFLVFGLAGIKHGKADKNAKILYYSEGLLGQILVTDVTSVIKNQTVNDRILFVNRMGQTFINKQTGLSRWSYINYLTAIASDRPVGSDVLLLGLGGGTVANQLQMGLQFNLDAVELDSRIVDVAKRFFNLSKDVNWIIDDARHYIETCEKKYDILVFDVFKGEIPPEHVLSVECFERAKTLLKDGGLMIINFNGFITGETGKSGRCLFKTLEAAGFSVKMLPTYENEDSRNVLYIALPDNKQLGELRTPLLYKGTPVLMDTLYLDPTTLDFGQDFVFTDDKPILAKFNLEAARIWRKGYNDTYTLRLMEMGVPLFE